MANGQLGKAMSSAGENVKVYTVPAGAQFATVAINAVNLGVVPANIKLAISFADTPGNADFIDFNTTLEANGGVLERTCQIMAPNEKVLVFCNTPDVAIRVSGLEQL